MPEVDSAIIKIATLINADNKRISADRYYKAVRILFAQPRKTVLNNLLGANGGEQIISENPRGSQRKSAIAEKLSAIGINPQDRPQNLSIEDIKKITDLLD